MGILRSLTFPKRANVFSDRNTDIYFSGLEVNNNDVDAVRNKPASIYRISRSKNVDLY